MLTLSEIWIYPVKSLGGIPLEKAVVQKKGLQYDRRWMLIDQHGVAMTQRVFPEMALFKLSLDAQQIHIAYRKTGKTISTSDFITTAPPSGVEITAQIWDDAVRVREVDPKISAWFSLYLRTPCKLVAFPEQNPRPVDEKYKIADDHVSLADAYPFLIIGQASLDDLNQRLSEPVPMNRFRPNFVFTGGSPFVEDSWRDISVGGLPFVGVKKSARCALTTVNQESGEKGAEPLRTLSAFRKVDHKIYFGQNLIALEPGKVTVGDSIIPG